MTDLAKELKKLAEKSADEHIDNATFFVKKEKKWVALACFGAGAMLLVVGIFLVSRLF